MLDASSFGSLVLKYSITSKERADCLLDSLEKTKNIEGDVVECGVYRGGNILGMAEFFYVNKINNKIIYAYDTYSGMTEPSDLDETYTGEKAEHIIYNPIIKCYSGLEEVKNNIFKNTRYDCTKIKFVVGDIRKTLDENTNLPEKVSLLRLDTDFYDSTKKELEVFWPLLSKGSIVIIDDYGHWKGCRRAVDEFFKDKNVVMEEIDYTGRKIVI